MNFAVAKSTPNSKQGQFDEKKPFSSPGRKGVAYEEARVSCSSAATGNLCRWLPVNVVGQVRPCKRSLHSAVVYENNMVIFGGYDGLNRVNDLYLFNFSTHTWKLLPSMGLAPSPRDRHTAVVHLNKLYVFGGYDGSSRVNDFFSYDYTTGQWKPVAAQGLPPTPRHSHSAVVHNHCMYIFGGYDGSYKKDFFEYNFVDSLWRKVDSKGKVPHARYRTACVVSGNKMVLFGGHDGAMHLDDTAAFDFTTQTWQILNTRGVPPRHRDSHVAVANGNSFFIFGGSTGAAMNDFHELNLLTNEWRQVPAAGSHVPCARFCHVAVSIEDSLVVFGGYDGAERLSDLVRFDFGPDVTSASPLPDSTLANDLSAFVNCELASDITFIIEDQRIFAHKLMCMRCPYLRSMLTSGMKESRQNEIVLTGIDYSSFLTVLEYLYTDEATIDLANAMSVYQVADVYQIERLKLICEGVIMTSVGVDNAATLLLASDSCNAGHLKEKCMVFILQNFDSVSKTESFVEMGRNNVELILDILKRR